MVFVCNISALSALQLWLRLGVFARNPKGARGHANNHFEASREMALIGKSRFLRDFDNRTSANQQGFCVFDSYVHQVLMRRVTDIPAEDTNQMEGA